MKRTTIRLLTALLTVFLLASAMIFPGAAEEEKAQYPCKSLVLMEASTGKVLLSQNENEALPPASVTKVMTLLLVMEAIDSGRISLSEQVTVSANAASMGGSQVFLKEGETMTVEELLKSVVIASANDAAVALAEYLSGSVSTFVEQMNKRAAALGMENTHFENPTGLDDTAIDHKTSALDIAMMSRELIKHKKILEYSSIWMDSIRDGAFGLTNTNRLVRYYPGCTGLKTGSTAKAGFCISATAEKNGMELICVVMGAESRDARNAIAKEVLDYGYANYGLYQKTAADLDPIPVTGGMEDVCNLSHGDFSIVLPKGEIASVKEKLELPASLAAPVKSGDKVGTLRFYLGEEEVGSIPVTASQTVGKLTFFEIFKRVFAASLLI